MARDTFKAGTAILISDVVRDNKGVLITPTSITVTIRRGTDTAAITNAAMTEESTGTYYYVWQTAANTPTGIYTVTTTCVYGGYTSTEEIEDLITIK